MTNILVRDQGPCHGAGNGEKLAGHIKIPITYTQNEESWDSTFNSIIDPLIINVIHIHCQKIENTGK